MSYILDALRKAEHDRHLGQPPTLVTLPPVAESGRGQAWRWWIALGLGANAALLAFFLTRTPPDAPGVAPSATAPIAVVKPASTTPPALPPAVEPASPVVTAKPAPAATSRPSSKTVAPQPPPPTVAARRERRETLSLQPAAPIASLDTLPASVRRDIPALTLDIHIHSPSIASRFVVINGRRYREGEALSEGPVLEAVTPDGVILRQGNLRFRLPVRR